MIGGYSGLRRLKTGAFTLFHYFIILQSTRVQSVWLRWLNTVLRAVSGNSREDACFKLDKLGGAKSNGTQKMFSQNLLIIIL